MQFVQIGNKVPTMKPVLTGVPQGSIIGPLLFNIFINDIVKASQKFAFILYADDTTLNSTLDSFGNNPEEIKNSIVRELEKIFKWLDVNKLCLNVTKSKFMIFQMPQKRVLQLSFNIEGYQMHFRLRNLANPGNQQFPNIDTLGTSIYCFFKYLITQFVRSYSNICNLNDCFVCANSN